MNVLRATLATIAVSASVAAQFQASNTTARRVGVHGRELESGIVNQSDLLTLYGPPGASYFTLLQIGGVNDQAYSFPFGGTFSEPYHIDLVAGAWQFADPLLQPNVGGVIPTTGFVDLSFPTANPLPIGTQARFQAVIADPSTPSGLSVSNGVVKTSVAPVRRPNFTTPYTVNTLNTMPGVSPDDYLEVEQADVDGDGDLDTLIMNCVGDISLLERVDGDLTSPQFIVNVPSGTALELADFDNDNFLDLVASSDSVLGALVFRNQGRVAGTTHIMGSWRGFALVPNAITFDFVNIDDPPLSIDVETADVDLDGYLDIVLACADDPVAGLNNRLLRNTFPTSGGISFEDITWTVLLQEQLWEDDTEDVEFYDLDGDLDLDIVFANVDGPTGRIGVDFVYINNLNQGTFNFTRRTIVAMPPNDETLDIVVADLNGDGAPDLYSGNWFFSPTNSGNFQQNTIVPDRLYLTVAGVPLSWVDASTMLPDNPNFVGPADRRIPPQASSDCEVTNADLFTPTGWGPLEILVSAGTRCNTTLTANGLRLLTFAPATQTTPAHYVNDRFPLGAGRIRLLPPAVQSLNINDLETGDWQTIYLDKDIGIAHRNLGALPGHIWLTR